MKILYITTIGSTMNFFGSFIKELLEKDHSVDIAANLKVREVPNCYHEWGCKVHPLTCSRSPLSKGNLIAIKEIQRLVADNHYDIVHCHTPIAAACTRIACRKVRKQGTKVFYTAHGFHFYKGAPLKNWLIFYPIEKLCSYWTDVLITINTEDYEFAKRKLKVKRTEYVSGVGIDASRFTQVSVSKDAKREEIGVPKEAFFMLSVGELNSNKNHEVIIQAMAQLKNPLLHYGIAGKGGLRDQLIALADALGVGNNVHLLGYRNDIPELYKAADVCVFPSLREGLGLAAIEGMASGLPLIVSNNRGTRCYALDNVNAIVCPAGHDAKPYADAIMRLMNDSALVTAMSQYNQQAAQKYDVSIINDCMRRIYGF